MRGEFILATFEVLGAFNIHFARVFSAVDCFYSNLRRFLTFVWGESKQSTLARAFMKVDVAGVS
jgi:hypothetical protein